MMSLQPICVATLLWRAKQDSFSPVCRVAGFLCFQHRYLDITLRGRGVGQSCRPTEEIAGVSFAIFVLLVRLVCFSIYI